jgi:hypothetical protein
MEVTEQDVSIGDVVEFQIEINMLDTLLHHEEDVILTNGDQDLAIAVQEISNENGQLKIKAKIIGIT